MPRILILLLLVSTLSACANVSRFQRDSLVAHGELLDGASEPLYYTIWIDLTKSVDERTLRSRLRFTADGPSVALAELNPELVASYLPPFLPPDQWPETWKKKAAKDESYSGGGFFIRFREGKLLSVGICSHCWPGRESPVVESPDGEHYYTLPLTQQQVTKVFGAPERVYKVNEVRY